jgi:hypothetical protein
VWEGAKSYDGRESLVSLYSINYSTLWFAVIDKINRFRPTLDELGILTPEEMGYDKPELALPSPYDIH